MDPPSCSCEVNIYMAAQRQKTNVILIWVESPLPPSQTPTEDSESLKFVSSICWQPFTPSETTPSWPTSPLSYQSVIKYWWRGGVACFFFLLSQLRNMLRIFQNTLVCRNSEGGLGRYNKSTSHFFFPTRHGSSQAQIMSPTKSKIMAVYIHLSSAQHFLIRLLLGCTNAVPTSPHHPHPHPQEFMCELR